VADRLVKEQKAHLRGEILAVSEAPSSGDRHEAQQTETISAAYLAAGLGAPSVPELVQQLGIAEAEMRRHVTLLLRQKVLIRMGSDDAFVPAQALRQLQQRLSSLRGKPLDVAAFKLLTGLTRKHAIPLLEYLDRERITRKQGDQRLVL
jgi:selenocysteine-specific elongation factor